MTPGSPSRTCGRKNKRNRKIKTSQIRQSFIDYFARRDHRVIPSSPVIPYDDPTILFVNAGMNQFKDLFTGRRKADYKRATSYQKCLRAGGKHNDLDNVGFTAQHHTFFEMLGNFSFGDYFKEEAISYAWEWVTKELKLPVERLYATVYETDDEAYRLWEKIAPQLKNGRLLRFGRKDNYWSMGETGPCGPCSEIHFDRGEKFGAGPDDVINGNTDRFFEIWNLVFMQYDQLPDGRLIPLPSPSVDTGAGLERLATIMQGADSTYGIDLFKGLIVAISELAHVKYADTVVSHHVVADHLRALVFAIADGAGISNEGQGYVLRRIIRRAARHGRLLGIEEPFIHTLVPVLTEAMGEAYPEIREKQGHIETVIRSEEEAFGRTLQTGLVLFEQLAAKATASGKNVVDGDTVFKLYDTYGFPYDLSEIVAAEHNLTLDRSGFESAMARQKEQSKAAPGFATHVAAVVRRFIDDADEAGVLSFEPTKKTDSDILEFDTAMGLGVAAPFPEVAVVLAETPFYVKAGGQVGDTGTIRGERITIQVESLYNHQGHIIHQGKVTRGTIDDLLQGTPVTAEVDVERRWDIQRNHTATHLTHAALREVLGLHVKQSGSYVGPDRLRFDFSHHQPMTPEQIEKVEQIVNDRILEGHEVDTEDMEVEAARKSGATALFGEKYSDRVRVISIGEFSKELCGGTHVKNVSQIGPYFITLETGIASGVRRLEAITGRQAIKYMMEAKQFRQETAALLGRQEEDSLEAVRQLKDETADLHKEIKRLKSEMFSGGTRTVGHKREAGKIEVYTHDFGPTDRDTMAGWIDTHKEMNQPAVAFALGTVDGKPTFMASASSQAIGDHELDVGKIAKELLPQFGGRGGGKPTFAQGTVANGTMAEQLFHEACSIVERDSK